MAQNLVELVMADHHRARRLFDRLQTCPADERQPAFRELVELLVSHEAAESLILYPAVIRFLPEGEPAARARLAEHRAQATLLARLQGTEPDSVEFDVVLDALEAVHAVHVREAEQMCIPLLQLVTSSSLLRRLGERYDVIRHAMPQQCAGEGPDGVDVASVPLPRLSNEAHRRAHQALARRAWTAWIGDVA